MTRCQSLRYPSLILWLDSHEAHGTRLATLSLNISVFSPSLNYFSIRAHTDTET